MQSLSIGRKSKARSGIFEGDENRAIGFHERALAAAFGRVRQGFAMAVAGRPSVVSREVSSRSAAAQDSATVHTRVPSAKTRHQKRSDSTAVTSQLPLRIPELKGSTEGTDECESEERRSEATRIPTRAAASLHSTKRATAHGEALRHANAIPSTAMAAESVGSSHSTRRAKERGKCALDQAFERATACVVKTPTSMLVNAATCSVFSGSRGYAGTARHVEHVLGCRSATRPRQGGDRGRQGEIWVFLPHLGATAVIAATRKALRVRRARG